MNIPPQHTTGAVEGESLLWNARFQSSRLLTAGGVGEFFVQSGVGPAPLHPPLPPHITGRTGTVLPGYSPL
ncbi:hypothetical protein J6590_019788 [Homalodisca vitripennis]|nr:hypothetical protein J6590_019788 [Homalodisca vitripennis]